MKHQATRCQRYLVLFSSATTNRFVSFLRRINHDHKLDTNYEMLEVKYKNIFKNKCLQIYFSTTVIKICTVGRKFSCYNTRIDRCPMPWVELQNFVHTLFFLSFYLKDRKLINRTNTPWGSRTRAVRYGFVAHYPKLQPCISGIWSALSSECKWQILSFFWKFSRINH